MICNGHRNTIDEAHVDWWKRQAGKGTPKERARRLMPHINLLFDLYLGPVEPMSNRELRTRWQRLFADRDLKGL